MEKDGRGGERDGDTDQEERSKDFANHDTYNGALEAGVSIEESHWKLAFVMFQGIGDVEAAKQALHRFRAVPTYLMSIRPSHIAAGPQTLEGLAAWIRAGEEAIPPPAKVPEWIQSSIEAAGTPQKICTFAG